MAQLNSQVETKFFLSLLFVSIQVLNGLDDAHPPWEGQYAFLSLPIQMLISLRNTLIDTARRMFN